MSNPYGLPGLNIVDLLDRRVTFEAICADLGDKPTPDHVSIVGPKYFGKTVLLSKLAEHFRQPESPYQIVRLWDLRHGTPRTDLAFHKELALQLDAGLTAIGRNEYHTYLVDADGDVAGNLDTVLQSMESEGLHVLVLLDDFDRLAAEPGITKNLWDNLRHLAARSNLRFVTTSRKRLRDLIPSHEARTSDFWNIFASTRTLKPLNQAGLDEFVAPLTRSGWSFTEGARKSLLQWTGGVPVLAALLCRQIWKMSPQGLLTEADIDLFGEQVYTEDARDFLHDLWDDCPQASQGDLIDIAANPDCATDLGRPRQQALIDRGYLNSDEAMPRPSCRLMTRFASKADTRGRDLRELFRDADSELRSLKGLLELKLSNIDGGSAEVRGYIDLAIRGLSHAPGVALQTLRSIAKVALTLIWEAEFPQNQIPPPVQQALVGDKNHGGFGMLPKVLDALSDPSNRRNILRAAVGNLNGRRLTTKASRPLMLLVDHLYNIGNYGQHIDDVPTEQEARVDLLFCAASCMSAIALLARMTEDLG